MILFSNCKINLGLRIIRKRIDGFHDIETIFYPLPFYDILEIVPSETKTAFNYSGIPIPGNTNENICFKAYQILKPDFPNISPVQLHLHKIIPPGSGLGAGSANGAHTLLLLNQIFKLGLSNTELRKYASLLGSDCAFFIENNTSLATGRGEILESVKLNLSGKHLLLVVPNTSINTGNAFQNVQPKIPESSLLEIINKPPNEWKGNLENDFEKSIFENHPELQNIKNQLYNEGALYASLSGTGSALYGIFDQPKDIKFSGSLALTKWLDLS